MKYFPLKKLLFIFLITFIFSMDNFAQTKIGLLPIKISFDKKDERSSKERLADMKATLEELKNRKESDNIEVNNKKKEELNGYEEQFVIMLTKNLKDYLSKEEIELTEIDVDEMTSEEREGEKLFYTNVSKNQIARIAKEAYKRKLKKPKTLALENDEPSIFIQNVAKKYEKEYIIYLKAIGSYERTHKRKKYRVNNTDLNGPVGALSVDVFLFEKTEGKMIYLTDHELARYSRSSGIVSGAFIHDSSFESFGKKVAKKINKAIK